MSITSQTAYPPIEREAIDGLVRAAWPKRDIGQDILRLLAGCLIDGLTFAAPLPPGPKVFLATGQFGIDLHLLGLVLAGFMQRNVAVATPPRLALSHQGEVLRPLLARTTGKQEQPKSLLGPLLWGQNSSAQSAALDTLSATAPTRPDLVLPVTADLQACENAVVKNIDLSLGTLASLAGTVFVPVKIAWGLPNSDKGLRYAWPYRLSPVHLFLGEPLRTEDPDTLASDLLYAFRDLGKPAPPGHEDRNAACAARTWTIVEHTGITQSKALVVDLLLAEDPVRLSEEGCLVRDLIRLGTRSPLAYETDWLANFAMLLSDGLATDDIPFADLYAKAALAPKEGRAGL